MLDERRTGNKDCMWNDKMNQSLASYPVVVAPVYNWNTKLGGSLGSRECLTNDSIRTRAKLSQNKGNNVEKFTDWDDPVFVGWEVTGTNPSET